MEHPDSNRRQERQPPSSLERYRSTLGPDGGIGFWDHYDIAICDDLDKEGRRKARRVESGSFPLASGVPNRVGLLRGYGNAINPILAAEFIKAAFESINP
jgi:DNA (cytosine-5)-methyltransferase 1